MKNNVKSFTRVVVSLPQYPHIKKIYSYADRLVYINKDARPEANVILLEPPAGPSERKPLRRR